METLKHSMNCAALSVHADPIDCTCGLQWRIALQTEQTMHAAWRKRAEEAEKQLRSLREELLTIADFAVGNGDVCEIIARRARAALKAPERSLDSSADRGQ
jgi:hypothetical protein